MTKHLRNILRGVGSILDVCPAERRGKVHPPSRSDADALRGDWERVGQDLHNAIQATARESGVHAEPPQQTQQTE